MQVTEACGADCLLAVAALGTELTDVQTCTLELPIRLLLRTRPAQFADFPRFARWRELTGAVLLMFEEKPGSTPEDLARLKGRLRQLAVANLVEFCEPVYSEFCALVFAVASSLASQAR